MSGEAVELESARLGTEDDLTAVELIAAEVARHAADQRGGALFLRREAEQEEAAHRRAAAVADDDGWLVVGTFAGVVFGYALARREVLVDGGSLGRLEELAVVPDAREVGIGEAMMNLVVDQLTAAGCLGVDAHALPGDRETKNFFESFGLKARLLVVHRSFE